MVKKQLKETDVLCYSTKPRDRKTVRRYYIKWRQRRNTPERCDNMQCMFHDDPLEWNSCPLPLILDHVNGNRSDNSPDNLRFLCPNCDSQLPTKGGRNKGRIRNKSVRGYEVKHRDGTRDAKVVLDILRGGASVRQTDVNSSSEGNET